MQAGTRINNRYEILSRFASGGMGTVYLVADHADHGKKVVLKTLATRDLDEQRLRPSTDRPCPSPKPSRTGRC